MVIKKGGVFLVYDQFLCPIPGQDQNAIKLVSKLILILRTAC